jgi:predicted phage-related endonuclease
MNGSETLTAGAYKIAHKLVTTSRIDTAALKKALPDIAEAFTKKTQSMRFTIV